MRILIKKIAGGQATLGGAVEGRRHLVLLIEAMGTEPAEPKPLFLDYAGIELATASYLRETLVTFHQLLRSRRSNFYIVIANATPMVREDMEVLARATGLAFLACSIDEFNSIVDITLIGALDPKQEATFFEVCLRGETSARELRIASAGQEDIGQTAFNNRLATLVNQGLIAEVSQGKSKRYRPVLTEGSYGE